MKTTLLRAALTAVLAVIVTAFASAGGPPARANHILASDEMTIFHSGVCTLPAAVPACPFMNPGPGAGGTVLTAALGVPFSVQIAVTAQPAPSAGFRFELAWTDATLSVAAGTTYLDTDLSLCLPPAGAVIAGNEIYGLGAGCIGTDLVPSLFVNPVANVSLVCVAPGTTQVVLVDVATGEDPATGTELITGIEEGPTIIENQLAPALAPSHPWGPTLAAVVVTCFAGGGPDNDGPVGTFGGTVPPAPAWIYDGTPGAPEAVHTGPDEIDVNDDNDLMCTDGEEPALVPARDPLNPWDFVDVSVPARPDGAGAYPAVGSNGVRNGAVTLSDVLSTLFYVGATNGGGTNVNGVDYDSDKGSWTDTMPANGLIDPGETRPPNGIEDGAEYDRTPTGTLGMSGPPSGAISLQDVGVVLAQVGDTCTAPPN